MGLALTEDYEDIKKQSTMAGAGIPDIKMIPDDMEIVYVESPRPDGPFGASGVGEMPLTAAACGDHQRHNQRLRRAGQAFARAARKGAGRHAQVKKQRIKGRAASPFLHQLFRKENSYGSTSSPRN